MAAFTFEILLIVLLLIANGVFAMSEMAVISARKARLQQWAKDGSTKARAALELARAPGHFLSTIQIAITLVGILAGAIGGTTLAQKLSDSLNLVPLLAPYSEAIGLGTVVISISYFSLVIGELVPKRIALYSPERIASAVAIPMRTISRIALPAVRLLTGSTEAALRMLGVRESKEPPITQEEIEILVEQGIEAGVFQETAREMVEGVLHLGSRRIEELMTPRTECVWLNLDDSTERSRQTITERPHSRFPVAKGSLDNIVGVVRAKDLLPLVLTGQPMDIETSLRQPLFVPEIMPAFKVLEMFKKSRIHMALVIDEHGSPQGLVTVHDILEAIVGEIPSIERAVKLQVVRRENGSWLLDGMLPVEQFKGIFHIRRLPREEEDLYYTLGGFVMTYLGHVPSVAERFEWGGLRFEVVNMARNRVDKISVVPLAH